MKNMEIGEIREYKGKFYECKKMNRLESECSLWQTTCGKAESVLGECASFNRKDRTDVVFVEVHNDKQRKN